MTYGTVYLLPYNRAVRMRAGGRACVVAGARDCVRACLCMYVRACARV